MNMTRAEIGVAESLLNDTWNKLNDYKEDMEAHFDLTEEGNDEMYREIILDILNVEEQLRIICAYKNMNMNEGECC